jgi:serine/threonine protein kinase
MKGTQNESDQSRLKIIKENTKKLLLKAEQIIQLSNTGHCEHTAANTNDDDLTRWNFDMCKYTHELEPYLGKYCGTLSELNENFLIKKVLHNGIYLIENKNDKAIYVMKTKLKTSSTDVNSRKSIVPFGKHKIKYMCRLLKYYENEHTIYLLLEYKKQVKLSNVLKLSESFSTAIDENSLKMKTATSVASDLSNSFNNSIKLDSKNIKSVIDMKTRTIYMAQILCCLDLLHCFGIYCKDLRLDNVLLDDEGY